MDNVPGEDLEQVLIRDPSPLHQQLTGRGPLRTVPASQRSEDAPRTLRGRSEDAPRPPSQLWRTAAILDHVTPNAPPPGLPHLNHASIDPPQTNEDHFPAQIGAICYSLGWIHCHGNRRRTAAKLHHLHVGLISESFPNPTASNTRGEKCQEVSKCPPKPSISAPS